MNAKTKKKIDSMSYKEMLSLWRFYPAGSPMLCDEVGKYFTKVFAQKRNKLLHDELVAISKEIGWER